MDRVREWVLVTAAGVAVGCVMLLAGDGPERSMGATLGRIGWWVLGSAIVAGVLVAGWNLAQDAARRRAAKRAVIVEKLTAAVVPVVGRRPGGHTVRVASWSRLEPRRLVVRYPREHDPEGASGRLASAVGDVATGPVSERGWDVRHERLRHRYVLTPKPEIDPEDRERERAEHRVVRIIKATIPGCKGVTVDAWGEDHTPTQITARFDPSPRLSSGALQAAVLRVVSDGFAGRWRSDWDHEHDKVTFAVRPELPRYVRRPLDLPLPEKLTLRYAVDDDGKTQGWGLDGPTPHALVIGPTGGGKTYCLRAMALDAIAQGVVVNGLDPKRIELMGLVGVPGVEQIATSPQEMADLIVRMKELMDERYEQIERREVERKDLQPVLFILDEFFILRMRLNQLWKAEGNKGNEHAALSLVWELLALARSARIHLCIGIQRPDAAFLDGPARDNVRHRVALGAVSAQGAQMMWESTEIGVDLPDIPGRAVASGANGPHEIQVYVVPDPDPHLDGTRSAEDQELLDALLAGAPATKGEQQPEAPAEPVAEIEAPDPAGPRETETPATAATSSGRLLLVDGRYVLPEEVDPEGAEPDPPAEDVPPSPKRAKKEPARVESSTTQGDIPAPSPSSRPPAPAAEPEGAIEEDAAGEWDPVPAEQLMEGDRVRIDGQAVVLLSADFDPMDEECTLLEWAEGSVSLPGAETLPRARDEASPEAA